MSRTKPGTPQGAAHRRRQSGQEPFRDFLTSAGAGSVQPYAVSPGRHFEAFARVAGLDA
jgi:hypothetical protein